MPSAVAEPEGRWNPWRALRDRPHIELWFGRLDGLQGMWQRDHLGELIVLDDRLDRRQRRCVLAHELVHAERGIGHGAATEATMEREEEQVRREVARRLVPETQLRAFVARSLTVGAVTVEAIAEEFDVDLEVAATAARHLQPAERENRR